MNPTASLLIIVSAISIGCASTSAEMRLGIEDESIWESSRADGAAYVSDAMSFRKPMKVRPKNNYRFYFKECSLNDEGTFYSKTSYWCTEGP